MKKWLSVVGLLSLFTSCSTEKYAPAKNVLTDIKTELSDISANQYVANALGRKSGMAALSLSDIYSIDFSGTPLAQMPLSSTFLGEDGFIIPGKAPIISAYKATSLMDSSKDAMLNLFNTGAYYEINSLDFTLSTIALNFSDQYLYKIEVPGIGYVGEANSSVKYITDQNGNHLYQDVMVYSSYDVAKPVVETMSLVQSEPLPILPKEMGRFNNQLPTKELYWFMSGNAEKHFATYEGEDTFKEVLTGQKYAFVPGLRASEVTKKHESSPRIVFKGRSGNLIEVSK